MKLMKIFLIGILSVFSFSSAFGLQTQTTLTNKPQSNQFNQKDGEILGLLIVLNKNEVVAARETLNKHVSPMVKQYALLLRNDHLKNLRDTIILGRKIGDRPVKTKAVVLLNQKGHQELMTLRPLDNKKYEIAYIDAMVKGHEEAINKIDQELLKNANNPELKKHLEATRTTISEHLQKAKAIQQRLKS